MATTGMAGAQTAPLYRWVDEKGQLHLGDRPPPEEAAQAEALRMPDYVEPPRPPDEDPYSILNQLERLEARRETLERERREREQAEREYRMRERELEARRESGAGAGRGPVYLYPWPPVHPRPPIHRPERPRPETRPPRLWEPDHPAYRPYPEPQRPVPPGSRIELQR